MKEIKKEIAEKLEQILETKVNTQDIETPETEHGDFAYPCMKAAAQKNTNPRKLAEKNREKIQQELEIIEKAEVAGPGYLNLHLNKEKYTQKITETLKQPKMGVEQKEGKILVEFSSPNLAKPMHAGHFRNNALGDSLQKIMAYNGYDVTSENYLGDWGAQYGKVIYAFKKYGDEEKFQENPMEHMYELYVKFHEKADKEREEKGQEWAKKIEKGDKEAKKLWEKFRDASIKYHKQDYQRMGIEFDRWTGESLMVERGREIIQEALENGTLEKDKDGSVFIEFKDEDMPGTVLLKEDGSTLYITRDLANLEKRNNESFDQNLYVVGSEQELNFKQLFNTAEKLDINTKGSEHIKYGLLSLPEGSMSSRKGRIIRLEDALDKAVEKAEEKIKDREISNAEEIGIGAVKYANLSVSRRKEITFNWDQVLDFEGDSGPYLQYSNTRAKSILEKTNTKGEIKGEITEEEYKLLKQLAKFPEKVENAAESREPAKIANYLSTLCEEFNTFYHKCPVLNKDEPATEARRVKIVELFVDVTDKGLELLGIKPLEEM